MTENKSAIAPALITALSSIVGTGNIYAYDQVDLKLQQQIVRSLSSQTDLQAIVGIVYPNTQEQLAEVVAFAARNQWQILPCGSGSKLCWGGLMSAGDRSPRPILVISTARINQLIEHAGGDLTVTVAAGMKFADLQAILAKSGQFLALDPAYPQSATIGGILATGNTGSLRQRYGGVRDMCLGISFVRSDGELVKAGGRVVKNVAGYDLMKLLTGSFGTLGIVSQLTFRLYPLPEASQTVVLIGEAAAIATVRNQILTSSLTPAMLDLLDRNVVRELELGSGLALAIRCDGIEASVKEQCDRLRSLANQLDLQYKLQAEGDRFWQKLHDLFWQFDKSEVEDRAVVCKVGILAAQAVDTLMAIEKAITTVSPDLSHYAQIHASSGLGVIRFEVETLPDEVLQDIVLKIRSLANATGGFLSVIEAAVSLKQKLDVWGYEGNAWDVMQSLKQKFDPHHLFSPQRFVC